MNAKNWFSRCWLGKSGKSVALAGTLFLGASESVLAQIVPDNTLGAESSVVIPNENIRGIQSDRIDGGATRGANLFHSFEQFNINAGRGAYFTNPAGIENIFSRVTGASRSEILGRLGVLGNGNANLFLINPQGIVFGSNASLDVQGSFIATTAEAVQLGDGGLFSATQPTTSNLLTVSPSAILFNTIAAQPIVNRSRLPGASSQPNSVGLNSGLQVQPGRTLALIGGNVLIEGGRLTAAGGRIELGSVMGLGEVSLTPNGNGFALGYDSINEFGDILLSNGAFVDTSGEGGGDIQLRGARLEMTQSSDIWADTLGAENGGEVLVVAAEIVLSDSSLLTANVYGTGTGGNLTIDTGRLLISSGAKISAATLEQGKGGNVQISADSIEVIGTSSDNETFSSLNVDSYGSGDAGSLTIDTGRLLISGGAEISATTLEQGKGGNVQISADSIEVIGTSSDNETFSSLNVDSYGRGDAGSLTIDTGRLLISGGAEISAATLEQGKGGNVQISADSIEVIGTSSDNETFSSLNVDSYGSGDAGSLTIDTGRLLISGGAEISATTLEQGKGGNVQISADSIEVIGTSSDNETFSSLNVDSYGSGDAGSLTIDTGRLLISGGAEISATTLEQGKGGNVQISADSIEVIGTSSDNETFSSLNVDSYGRGDAGSLTIDTGRLLISGGAEISADTLEQGKGGSLQITADDSVEVIGESADGFVSTLTADSDGSGDAGDLTIDTGRLLVQGGGQVSTNSFKEGRSGNLQITADDSVEVIGTSTQSQEPSGLRTQSDGSGDAGDLTIETGRLLVQGGGQVSTNNFKQGRSGNLQITADDSVEVIGTTTNSKLPSLLDTQSGGSGDAGDLTIETGRLLVQGGGQISTASREGSKGGSLQITAFDAVEVIGSSTNNSQIVSGLITQSQGNTGDAGDLTIHTGRLLVQGGGQVLTNTRGQGNGGSLEITATDSVAVIGASEQFSSGLITQSEGSGEAGDLTIKTGRLLVQGGAGISTSVRGEGNGGSLQITATESVEVIGRSADGQNSSSSSLIAQSEGIGKAGDLTIKTGRLLVSDGAEVSSSSRGEGAAGNINITARDTLQADNGTISTNTSRSTGGAIAIDAGDIRLSGDSDIRTDVNSGADNSGTITLTANSIIAFDDSDILAFARDGRGGDITLNTPAFFGENYRPAPDNTNPDLLDNNNQVDINASAANSGIILTPDVSFIQNSLLELPENQINTDSILANSCVVRRNQPSKGSFTITGTGGFPQRPGDAQASSFPTVDIQTLPRDGTTSNSHYDRLWQKGDPIVKPQGVYRLPNGKLILSRECS